MYVNKTDAGMVNKRMHLSKILYFFSLEDAVFL